MLCAGMALVLLTYKIGCTIRTSRSPDCDPRSGQYSCYCLHHTARSLFICMGAMAPIWIPYGYMNSLGPYLSKVSAQIVRNNQKMFAIVCYNPGSRIPWIQDPGSWILDAGEIVWTIPDYFRLPVEPRLHVFSGDKICPKFPPK